MIVQDAGNINFTEATRKSKRFLLSVSVVGILLTTKGVNVKLVKIFDGIEITASPKTIFILLAIAILYQATSYFWILIDEIKIKEMEWESLRLKIASDFPDANVKAITEKITSPPRPSELTNEKEERHRWSEAAISALQIINSANINRSVRIRLWFLDVIVPALFALLAFVFLVQSTLALPPTPAP